MYDSELIGIGRAAEICTNHNHARNVINGNHVNGVINIRHLAELLASLDHADQEIVRVGDTGFGVAGDVAGTDNGAGKTAAAGFTDNVLAGPLGLTVAVPETLS